MCPLSYKTMLFYLTPGHRYVRVCLVVGQFGLKWDKFGIKLQYIYALFRIRPIWVNLAHFETKSDTHHGGTWLLQRCRYSCGDTT